MSDELKPCPFCGGEAEHFGAGGNHCIRCTVCEVTNETLKRGSMVFDAHRTAEEAAAAWNARATVTDEQFSMAVHDGRAWQVARECENLLDDRPCDFECSECGFSVRTVPEGPADWQTPFWSYCPNCGGRVKVVAE